MVKVGTQKICNNCKYMGKRTIGVSYIGYMFKCKVKRSMSHVTITTPLDSCASFKWKKDCMGVRK
jgi:hypothetical protein